MGMNQIIITVTVFVVVGAVVFWWQLKRHQKRLWEDVHSVKEHSVETKLEEKENTKTISKKSFEPVESLSTPNKPLNRIKPRISTGEIFNDMMKYRKKSD